MANDYGRARSNYFHVHDVDALRAALPEDIEILPSTDDPTAVGLFSNESDTGNWPSTIFNEVTQDDDDIDLITLIAPHVIDGDVVVLMEAGWQKNRYIYGNAVAFNNQEEIRIVNLYQIYKLAEELGTSVTAAEY